MGEKLNTSGENVGRRAADYFKRGGSYLLAGAMLGGVAATVEAQMPKQEIREDVDRLEPIRIPEGVLETTRPVPPTTGERSPGEPLAQQQERRLGEMGWSGDELRSMVSEVEQPKGKTLTSENGAFEQLGIPKEMEDVALDAYQAYMEAHGVDLTKGSSKPNAWVHPGTPEGVRAEALAFARGVVSERQKRNDMMARMRDMFRIEVNEALDKVIETTTRPVVLMTEVSDTTEAETKLPPTFLEDYATQPRDAAAGAEPAGELVDW